MFPIEIDIVEMFDRIDYHTALAIKHHHILYREVKDLQQDMILAVFIRSKDFDSTLAAWSTFLNI